MKYVLPLRCLVFLFFVSLQAQQNEKWDSLLNHHIQNNRAIDSLVNISRKKKDDTLKVIALSRLYNIFLYTAPKLSQRFAQKEIEVSKQINFRKGIGWGTYHLGAYFQNSGNIDSARYYYKEALATHKKLGYLVNFASVTTALAYLDQLEGDNDGAIELYNEALKIYVDSSEYQYAIALGDRANIYIKKGFYRIALEQTLHALRILETFPDKPHRTADALRQVGYIEFLRNNYTNALDYFEQAFKVYKEQGDIVYQGSIHVDIGNTLYYLEKYDAAIVHLNEGLHLSREHNITENEGNALNNLGKVHASKGDYERAISYLNDALAIHKRNKFKTNILFTQNEIGAAYLEMEKPQNAISYLNSTIESAMDEGPINELLTAYRHRSQAFQKMGRWKEAIDDQTAFQTLNDSVFNISKTRQIEELRTIYETEKKEQQIALQEREITVLEQRASINNLQRLLMGILLLFSIILLYAFRQKMKRNKLERQKVAAELAFKKKELTTHALNLARKNEVLEGLKRKAQELKQSEASTKGYAQLIRTIDFDLQDDDNWENFSKYFEQVHKDFNGNIKRKYPDVTSNELRLLALLKMNLSSKEIANILNISQEGIKKARYRLRKKLDITTEESLQDLVLSL